MRFGMVIDLQRGVDADPVLDGAPDAPVDEVVREMAGHKYGSAVVVDNGHVVGVFTAIDAMTAFAELLETRLR